MSGYRDRLARLEVAREQREEAAIEAQIVAWIDAMRARSLPVGNGDGRDWRAEARRDGVTDPDALLGRVVAIVLARPDLYAQLRQAIGATAV